MEFEEIQYIPAFPLTFRAQSRKLKSQTRSQIWGAQSKRLQLSGLRWKKHRSYDLVLLRGFEVPHGWFYSYAVVFRLVGL